jgi:hypothetical protein
MQIQSITNGTQNILSSIPSFDLNLFDSISFNPNLYFGYLEELYNNLYNYLGLTKNLTNPSIHIFGEDADGLNKTVEYEDKRFLQSNVDQSSEQESDILTPKNPRHKDLNLSANAEKNSESCEDLQDLKDACISDPVCKNTMDGLFNLRNCKVDGSQLPVIHEHAKYFNLLRPSIFKLQNLYLSPECVSDLHESANSTKVISQLNTMNLMNETFIQQCKYRDRKSTYTGNVERSFSRFFTKMSQQEYLQWSQEFIEDRVGLYVNKNGRYGNGLAKDKFTTTLKNQFTSTYISIAIGLTSLCGSVCCLAITKGGVGAYGAPIAAASFLILLLTSFAEPVTARVLQADACASYKLVSNSIYILQAIYLSCYKKSEDTKKDILLRDGFKVLLSSIAYAGTISGLCLRNPEETSLILQKQGMFFVSSQVLNASLAVVLSCLRCSDKGKEVFNSIFHNEVSIAKALD